MAIFRDLEAARQSQIDHAAYDEKYGAGENDPHAKAAPSGIYRCDCGEEIVHKTGDRFPPTHDRAAIGHRITWRLMVLPKHKDTEEPESKRRRLFGEM